MGFVLYLFSFVLLLYGLNNLNEKFELDKAGVITQGVVYNLMVIEPYRRAEVRFTTQTGQTVQFVDALFWNQDFEAYKKGQSVAVIYDPKAPQQTATINDFFQRNTKPFWPMIVGAIVFLVGFIMRKILLGKARRYELN